MDPRTTFGTAHDLTDALGETGYLADDALATITWLALRLGRPLLMEGEPGTGKTALAEALAETMELPLIRLQCYEGIDATQALYDWDFPRQILHVRALEAVEGAARDVREVEQGLFDERLSASRARCCAPCATPRPCCSSTRSTGPTTSSRPSSWRCSRPGR